MKNFILGLLITVFSFITVHDYVVEQKDHDTQAELIFKASGKITYEQMCNSSQVHDILHEMVICSDLFESLSFLEDVIHTRVPFQYHTFSLQHRVQTLYRPPIA